MLINELAQWAALIFLGIFVVGLTRQLGRYMVSEREEIAHSVGPDVGKALPRDLLPTADRERLAELIGASEAGWGVVVVVDPDCPGCAALLQQAEREGMPEHAPAAAVTRSDEAEFAEYLGRVFDVAVADAGRVERAGLQVTPFVLIVDGALRIAHKALTADVSAAVAHWRSQNGRAPARNDDRLVVETRGS